MTKEEEEPDVVFTEKGVSDLAQHFLIGDNYDCSDFSFGIRHQILTVQSVSMAICTNWCVVAELITEKHLQQNLLVVCQTDNNSSIFINLDLFWQMAMSISLRSSFVLKSFVAKGG
uniref:Uncharacterized protein n=1 Tax=Romanomermis culicivorax TaxID=13658 RepID=A0A915IER9_ROMCU